MSALIWVTSKNMEWASLETGLSRKRIEELYFRARQQEITCTLMINDEEEVFMKLPTGVFELVEETDVSREAALAERIKKLQRERNYLKDLLKACQMVGFYPPALDQLINTATAEESEEDIQKRLENARNILERLEKEAKNVTGPEDSGSESDMETMDVTGDTSDGSLDAGR